MMQSWTLLATLPVAHMLLVSLILCIVGLSLYNYYSTLSSSSLLLKLSSLILVVLHLF